jgi:hypothetical protein
VYTYFLKREPSRGGIGKSKGIHVGMHQKEKTTIGRVVVGI